MRHHLLLVLASLCALGAWGRTRQELTRGWLFARGDTSEWTAVTIPHDWGIEGPFDIANDLQRVVVEQNGEQRPTLKTGRTGGLPFTGKGYYKRWFDVPADSARAAHVTLLFGGAMSNARVRVNGRPAGERPYGYVSFTLDVDSLVRPGRNLLEVELENKPLQSRWYPGAGLYRNVHLVTTGRVHVPTWGTQITTPRVSAEAATVTVATEIAGARKGERLTVATEIYEYGDTAAPVARARGQYVAHGQRYTQHLEVTRPRLWSPETPWRYRAVTRLLGADAQELDRYETPFGIRSLEYVPRQGLFLNGERTTFRGVCLHHDLGPLGAAVNRSALRHQLEMLRDMGANAVRTSHNMPAPELVDLCDELGLMLMVEPFDDWGYRPKSPNGYGSHFEQWARRDVTDMVRAYRNSPSVVMWSIGNEVPSQRSPEGIAELSMLQDLVHSLDATRPVTCGMDQIGAVLDNGFAAALDIPGFNYKPLQYRQALEALPQGLVLGTETASTVSSRGVYHFPLVWEEHYTNVAADHQGSGYDNEACPWSNAPDIDLAMDQECAPWLLGQFVWTGFDYLGEPSPYDTDAWPSHSSLFGIIDLASLPKDRYWLYRSQWNRKEPTLHLLPHWTWPGREGRKTPVMVYTSYPEAELYVNGRSQGRRRHGGDGTLQGRFRLIWPDVAYEPGELTAVAYDEQGREAARTTTRTAGAPARLRLAPHKASAKASGDDLVYFTVTAEDAQGTPVPTACDMVAFNVSGDGSFEAAANGDPTCLLPFREPRMTLFSGAATAIVRAAALPPGTSGKATLTATAPGLAPATFSLPVVSPKKPD